MLVRSQSPIENCSVMLSMCDVKVAPDVGSGLVDAPINVFYDGRRMLVFGSAL